MGQWFLWKKSCQQYVKEDSTRMRQSILAYYALPVCRTPRPAEFQGPGVVPMIPNVNIEHQILEKQAEAAAAPPEKAVSVKKEDGWDLVATDPDMTSDTVVIRV